MATGKDVILEINDVFKRFSGPLVLDDISIKIDRATIHGLVGKNGAGKSTLVNIITGIVKEDSGDVIFDGENINSLSVFERQDRGIRMVTQHASIVPHLTVAENIFMGVWPKKNLFMVDWPLIIEQAKAELDKYGMDVDPSIEVRFLDPVDQRKVNIVRALFSGAKLVILDEPTTALTGEERENLFYFINELKESGVSFIFITHYLEEVLKMSDEITVLRDGKAYTGYTRETANEEMISSLVAGDDVKLYCRQSLNGGEDDGITLKCENLRGKNMKGISFSIKKGEVAGFIGFPGSGVREVCRAIYGLEPLTDGKMFLNNREYQVKHPIEAIKRGVAYIPNDRHAEGIIQTMTINDNITLPALYRLKNHFGLINSFKQRAVSSKYFDKLRIKALSIDDPINSLSGGNQQKAVLAKILAIEPRLLVLDEPTVGIDVSSREEILSIVGSLCQEGISIIYLTNDYSELLRVADKLFFFTRHRLRKIMDNDGLDIEKVISIRDSLKEGGHVA